MATGDARVLETVLGMTAVSLEYTELDPATLVLAIALEAAANG